MTRDEWRAQVEHGIADHRAHGKEPQREPSSPAEWDELYARFSSSPLRAIWFAITGRELVRTARPNHPIGG